MANIFISHASADEKYISPFVNIILKQALGLRDEEITCTSFENTGILPGMCIPNYIIEKINMADVFLVMASLNYKTSEVCNNEIGAAMGLKKNIIQLLVPKAKFSELNWMLNHDKAANMDNGSSLDHLAEAICNGIGISMLTPVHWNPSRDSFLEKIAELVKNERQKDSEEGSAITLNPREFDKKQLEELFKYFSFNLMDDFTRNDPDLIDDRIPRSREWWSYIYESSTFFLFDVNTRKIISEFDRLWGEIIDDGEYYYYPEEGRIGYYRFYGTNRGEHLDEDTRRKYHQMQKQLLAIQMPLRNLGQFLQGEYQIDIKSLSERFETKNVLEL